MQGCGENGAVATLQKTQRNERYAGTGGRSKFASMTWIRPDNPRSGSTHHGRSDDWEGVLKSIPSC